MGDKSRNKEESPMLVLRSSPPSPFGRKIKIAADVLGLSGRIEVVLADTNNPADELRRQNPLGKIPTLVLDDGDTLYDSRLILDYLDDLAGGGKIIPAGAARFPALRLQSLADGIMDAAILQIYEVRFRTEDKRDAGWVAYQAEKIDRALAYLEEHEATLPDDIHVGHIALACALGYLDLRFGGRWREKHPRLVAFHDAFESRVPSFAKTRVTP
jgi:glutathione S-transferase